MKLIHSEWELREYIISYFGMSENQARKYIRDYPQIAKLNYWRYLVSEEERSIQRRKEKL